MTPSRPYLIRGLYEWIADNNLTSYIAVNSQFPNVVVPQKYVKDGKIVLNISQRAVHNLRIGSDAIEFDARFSGKLFHIYLPIPSITAIFAQETSQGMTFSSKDIENYEYKTIGEPFKTKTKKPHLKLIKSK
ncbi:MAG: hypothetical protein AMJ43_00875 [Coxiella sp. DG_40]|nr:MAG: hypothetical protein AMJ43_00875 [Coxiella sp. DG_40]